MYMCWFLPYFSNLTCVMDLNVPFGSLVCSDNMQGAFINPDLCACLSGIGVLLTMPTVVHSNALGRLITQADKLLHLASAQAVEGVTLVQKLRRRLTSVHQCTATHATDVLRNGLARCSDIVGWSRMEESVMGIDQSVGQRLQQLMSRPYGL